MKRNLILTSAVAVALAVGGCAGTDKKTDTASAKTAKTAKAERPWWKIPKSWKKEPDFKVWTYGDVRQGKGLLSDDKDGFVVFNKPSRGSADPSKPEKVRR